MDEIDWKAFYAWRARQTVQLSLREEAEMISEFDNGTDEESLELDRIFAEEERKSMKPSKVSPSVHHAIFFGRICPAIMDDFGNLVPLNFYNLAISINSHRDGLLMKNKNKRKYVVFGKAETDAKPFLCYSKRAKNLPFNEDDAKLNCYSARYCLMTKKEARKTISVLETAFPDTIYGMKKFLS